MKFSLSFTVMASMAVAAFAEGDVCHDSWSYDTTLGQCSATLGYDPWGWTNGRYGMSGCTDCDCPDCPTEAPTPNMPPTPITPAPTPPPVPLPQTCIGFAGSASGDPHIRTLDRLTYDCQGEGEFHLLKSMTSGFEVQARFTRFTPDSRPTKTAAVAWNTGDGEPKMQVNAPDVPDEAGTCMPTVYVENVLKDVMTEGVGNAYVQVARWVRPKSVKYVFYYHNSGFQVTVQSKKTSQFGCVLSVKVCLPYDWERTNEALVGLLGSPDNDSSNDWMNRQNVPQTIPENRRERLGEIAYDYCVDNWCIRKADDSLFHYGSGESYNGYNHCALGNDPDTQHCIDDPPKEVEEVCGNDDYECIVDGCAGGEEEAKNWLITDTEGLEGECGREVFFEDFDTPYATSWGEIAKGDLDTSFLRLHKDTPKFIKQFTVPKTADMVRVDFLFYEIGHWEGGVADRDWVHFFVWDTPIDLRTFDSKVTEGNVMESFEGFTRGLNWKRMAVTNATDMGFGSNKDQMHKVTVNIPRAYYADGQLRIGFLVSMSHSKNDESAGIDDFQLSALGIECDLEFDPVPARDVNIDPVELPVACEERVAVVWGDPHIQTFDGMEYDCQGEGEFVLAQSEDKKMEIQGRLQRFTNNKQVSVLKSMAVKEVNASIVEVGLGAYSNGKCDLDLFVNGKQIDPNSGYFFEHVVVSNLEGQAIVMYYPFTGLQVVAEFHYSKSFGCYLSTKICVPDSYRYGQKIIGLLGSNDGDPSNDWMRPNGNTVPIVGSMRFSAAYNYCTSNWCITDFDDSLFTHDNEASFNSVSKCDQVYTGGEHEACVNSPSTTLAEICGDDESCIVDGCAGDDDDGMAAIDDKSGIVNERGCGIGLLDIDFQDGSYQYGLVAHDPSSGQGYRLFYQQYVQFAFTLGSIPPVSDRIRIEFLVYSTTDYKHICMDYGQFCEHNKILVAFGTANAQTFLELDMFGMPNLKMREYKQGVRLRRQALSEVIHRIELQIPKKFFDGDLFAFDMRTIFGHPTFSLGMDDFKLKAYSDKCKQMRTFYYYNYGAGAATRRLEGLRITSNDPPATMTMATPVSRRLDKNYVLEDHPVSRDLRGSFNVNVQTDECQCICPSVSGSNDPSTAPVTMNLYIGANDVDCLPQGDAIGTVTMAPHANGTVTISYQVDAGYYITDISIWTGEEALPGLDTGNVLPAIEFPVTDSPEAGTVTVEHNVEVISCDFYLAAYARVCGDFPPTPGPTAAPSKMTASPTSYPTKAPVPVTDSPTFSPTATPSVTPTTLAPTIGDRTVPTTPAPKPTPAAPTPAAPTPAAPTPAAPTPAAPTPAAPTPAAPTPAAPTPGSYGDPHIMTWNGTEYDVSQ
ncbi:Sushi domain-containing protein 2 [Seminavis robusta]|uniref:Sushi domain-containing protein 2 n=1 Tax=Seminavis robusta TaxID=568900 RepID=A0A9N8HFM4_9STRA|nr:Sushi domain-containing protein 2 [Seminavis robusta]|eukprot:Sro580_g170190.1 Sushi domain-containing protein 2 (1358) ;mRNA; f:47815-52129